jgi:hypothetical protein
VVLPLNYPPPVSRKTPTLADFLAQEGSVVGGPQAVNVRRYPTSLRAGGGGGSPPFARRERCG